MQTRIFNLGKGLSHHLSTQRRFARSAAKFVPPGLASSVPPIRYKFKYSGIALPDDPTHGSDIDVTADEYPHIITPDQLGTADGINGTWGTVLQYADTVSNEEPNIGYKPHSDCLGYFTASQFKYNNNCYAYSVDIAPNSWPQPGRSDSSVINPLSDEGVFTADQIQSNAEADGLKTVFKTDGVTPADSISDLKTDYATRTEPGHYVALLFSEGQTIAQGTDEEYKWLGDYHWARCDNILSDPTEWSQKNGHDEITLFDFGGDLISDPSIANWKANQGPIKNMDHSTDAGNINEFLIEYKFHCYMWVPFGGVTII